MAKAPWKRDPVTDLKHRDEQAGRVDHKLVTAEDVKRMNMEKLRSALRGTPAEFAQGEFLPGKDYRLARRLGVVKHRDGDGVCVHHGDKAVFRAGSLMPFTVEVAGIRLHSEQIPWEETDTHKRPLLKRQEFQDAFGRSFFHEGNEETYDFAEWAKVLIRSVPGKADFGNTPFHEPTESMKAFHAESMKAAASLPGWEVKTEGMQLLGITEDDLQIMEAVALTAWQEECAKHGEELNELMIAKHVLVMDPATRQCRSVFYVKTDPDGTPAFEYLHKISISTKSTGEET